MIGPIHKGAAEKRCKIKYPDRVDCHHQPAKPSIKGAI
jgi:hypothetical protein